MTAPDRERSLTVVHVREREDCAEVMFVESARIYRLPRSHAAYRRVTDFLERAAAAGQPVIVRFDGTNDEIIESAGDSG